ncbi:MAG: plasmid partitioning protein RepB C-terminal domain-containing protein [Candidatus Didemnitutus sp.]|nr:plasmid partitioning protein RepB C-terminal domain-containing protein [Candidatus Didemnitutus sp.]
MSDKVRTAFELDGVTLPLSAIHPIRQVKPLDHAWGKYRAVLASLKEVGLIEPLIVFPQRGARDAYLLLDGHMRLKALHELGRTEAFCLVASDDDAFTYNDKVNRLSLIQEHAMIVRAIEHGVTPEQISKALSVDPSKVRSSLNLLDGIDAEAVELLKEKPITATALKLFRKAKPVRQVDMAQLMVSGNNYTWAYAEALILGTPAEQLVGGSKPKSPHGISDEEVTRMEKEMEVLERDYRLHQDKFGENSLHLNAAQRYVKRLLENAKIKRFMANRYPELLEEIQELAALEAL